MDLWILSQDRGILINAEKIYIKKKTKPKIIGQNNSYFNSNVEDEKTPKFVIKANENIELGTYDTLERVLEIFYEIYEHLDYLNIGEINRLDENGHRVSTIYDMPEE